MNNIESLLKLEKERIAHYSKFNNWMNEQEDFINLFIENKEEIGVENIEEVVNNNEIVYFVVGSLLHSIVKEGDAYIEYYINCNLEAFEQDNTNDYKAHKVKYLKDFDENARFYK